jgi:WXG100 family type VII secretion target
MGSGNPNIDESSLDATANDVRSIRDDILCDLKKLQSIVEHDLASAWQGAAASSFQHLMQCWNKNSKTLLQSMSDIADLLDEPRANQADDEPTADDPQDR